MANPELRGNHLPATPEQAADLLEQIGTITTFLGKNMYDRSTYEEDLDEIPAAIAEHLPSTDDRPNVSNSLYAMQRYDHATGQPIRDGVVAILSITQSEKPNPGMQYASTVNYHITSQNGGISYGIERHVTSNEHGVGAVRRELATRGMSPEDRLERLTKLHDDTIKARQLELAMGLTTVTHTEAQQLIALTTSLSKEL